MSKKWLGLGVAILVFVSLLAWLFVESTKPLPGEKIAYNCDNFIDYSKIGDTSDKCRAHVADGTKVNYSTNPPVFGPHYTDWTTKGFYDTPRSDGNLVHSEEHGYVVIWYDCEKQLTINNEQLTIISNVYAQEATVSAQMVGSEGSASASLSDMPKSFSDGSCDNLKNKLKDTYNSSQHKLIVVPRVGMDHPVVLTAWGRILKLNNVDQGQIKSFIDAFRDVGPENTVEP